MSDDPAHKAMLYFLEVLMNSNGPLTISQLAGRFGSRNFSPEMRTAAGGNESGLKKFLLKYPSLFTVRGNMVSLFDGKSTPGDDGEEDARPSLPDVSTELAAVQYFQMKLAKKDERWVQIKSLAGHLSQAEADIRNAVGPQLDFRKWLLRHPHIFDVQGELVGLKDGVAAVATPAIPRSRISFDEVPAVKAIPPKTPPASRRAAAGTGAPKSPGALRRSRSFGDKTAPLTPQFQREHRNSLVETAPAPDTAAADAPITVTASEYKAITWLKELIEKQPRASLKLGAIMGHYADAPEAVRLSIGWTKQEMEDFMRRFASVFLLEGDMVSLVRNTKLNVIITGSRPGGVRSLNGRKGKVFHVAKLWGIIDLGKHEHVFFDKSIMRRPIEDLSREYKPGEVLCFHAVMAPKSSRAKWRATHVWRETDRQPSAGSTLDLSMDGAGSGGGGPMSPAGSIVEDEINRFLPQDDYRGSMASLDNDKFSDADTSSTGNVTVHTDHAGDRLVPERTQLSRSAHPPTSPTPRPPTTTASAPQQNGAVSPRQPRLSPPQTPRRVPTTAEVSCQTISTGDIIATHLFYED